jgi:hypothetical protein
MSNYPPGVTGNEYAISGPEFERDEYRECPTSNVTIRTVPKQTEVRIKAAIDQLRNNPRSQSQVIMHLQFALSDIEDVEIDECPFAGDVTVQGYDGIMSWECPVCRVDHEETPEEDDRWT